MNGAAFPSPTSEMAEMNRIHYEIEYTEGISQRMRIPEKLQVAPSAFEDPEGGAQDPLYSVPMHVPERIVVAGDSESSQYPRPRDLDLIQSTPLESLALKTPPRVLTLNDRPLDFMEMERSAGPGQAGEEARSQTRSRRERSASENALVRQNGQLPRIDSTVTPPPPARLPPPHCARGWSEPVQCPRRAVPDPVHHPPRLPAGPGGAGRQPAQQPKFERGISVHLQPPPRFQSPHNSR
ncbi:mitochondrial fission factor homolog B-like isoform X3 [Anguilla anguilla]|uniref:mitochondrial fission factor homolog B-like isoform X3 n=1 Tax=Anguilla anguilla TaxID=7936 RepID=UPI0015B0F2E4|nr:mitochondrial fission factor homolog B-like isoform X3 [Anguilla anguilla]